jgi:hypothetical protein
MDYSTGLLTNRGWQVSIITNGNLMAGIHNGTSLTTVTNATWVDQGSPRFRLVAHWGGTNNVLTVWGQSRTGGQQYEPTNSLLLAVTNSPAANAWSSDTARLYACGIATNASGNAAVMYIYKASLTE